METFSQDESDLFDSDLESALQSFQMRHGLDANGVLNAETIRELNISVEDRIRQIQVNMERWRWLDHSFGKSYIMVNVADYRLSVISNHHVFMSMNVVVGQEYRRTPSFASKIIAIETNPKWNVPQKLIKEDLIPILHSNPKILIKKGFHFYSKITGNEISSIKLKGRYKLGTPFHYRAVQDSGPANALGRLKFWIPNQFGIFLHDTPARDLFEKRIRTFSSGCIRIERPFELAHYLLQNHSKWSKVSFEKKVLSGLNQKIAIKSPIPIYLLYWTAWVDEQGRIQFRPDVYGRNWKLDKKLHEKI